MTSGFFSGMDDSLGFLRMSDPLELDDGTVDRLLDGMPVDDAPPSYRSVAHLLGALRSAPTEAELAGEADAVASLVVTRAQRTTATPSRHPSPRHPSRPSRPARRRLRVTGAALVGTASLFVGLGAAGALPGAAQGVASDVLATVGVTAPNPDSHAGTKPAPDDHPVDASTRSSDGASTATNTPDGRGGTISGLTPDPGTPGIDTGSAASSTASDGNRDASASDPASSEPGPPGGEPPGQSVDAGGNTNGDGNPQNGTGNGNGTGAGAGNGDGNDNGNSGGPDANRGSDNTTAGASPNADVGNSEIPANQQS